MNRKYIDFVPKNSNTAANKPVRGSAQVIMPTPVESRKKVEEDAKTIEEAKAMKAKKVAMKPSSVMGDGMVRSATKRSFVVKKSSARMPAEVEKKVKEAKEEEILKAALTKADNLGQTLNVPQTRFVNTDKIVKRPLSKNVYQKNVVKSKEEVSQGPVTIIQKPEKDSKVGLVVTIIITIILGAAAGTVAFLLLPK